MPRGPYVARPDPAGRTEARPSEVLATNIRAFRVLRRFTQYELAVRMTELCHGWGRSTVSAVEARNRNVTTDELFGLAVTFGVTIGELLDPTGPDCTRRVSLDVGLTVVGGGAPRLIDPDLAQLWAASRVIVGLGRDAGREYALDVADLPVAAERRLAALRTNVGQ